MLSLNIPHISCQIDGRVAVKQMAEETRFTKNHFRASMVLSAVGDSLGYRNGEWEFLYSGTAIHDELFRRFNGLRNVNIKGWRVSDDTVMHIATAKGILDFEVWQQKQMVKDQVKRRFQTLKSVAKRYLDCRKDLSGRDPGITCLSSLEKLDPENPYVPFNPRGGGCGAAMRAMCIGLRYSKPEDLNELIHLSVEAGRMTHHHPTGYLGSFVAALFTSYAIQGIDVRSWGCNLLHCLEAVQNYVKESNINVQDNLRNWEYFSAQWKNYLGERHIEDGQSDPVFPEKYGVVERDDFYKRISFDGWGGASGHDAPIIAYDALLGSNKDWSELCNRAMFHGGDSDSTGVIAGAWYGALYGFDDVPNLNYENIEYRKELEDIADRFHLLHTGKPLPTDELVERDDDTCPLTKYFRDLFSSF